MKSSITIKIPDSPLKKESILKMLTSRKSAVLIIISRVMGLPLRILVLKSSMIVFAMDQ